MGRYQIRTPEEKAIEDVLNEMATSAWDTLVDHMELSRHSEMDFEKFKDIIHNAVLPYIRTFRLCGLSNICLDEIKTAPLSEHPRDLVDVNPWDLVYHIFYRGDAAEFVDGIAFEALESVKHILKKGEMREAFTDVVQAMRSVLGKYLYYSPVCGHTELCVFSSSAPVTPWGRH